MFEHLLKMLDNQVPVFPGEPPVMSPAPPAVQGESQAMRQMRTELASFSEELPYDMYQMRTILRNMATYEALNAPKASDRLKAMELVGKAHGVDYFVPDKLEITKKTPEDLRNSISDRLARLFGNAEDAQFTELPE